MTCPLLPRVDVTPLGGLRANDAGRAGSGHGEDGAQFLADAMVSWGVDHVFFVDAILRETLVELERRGVAQSSRPQRGRCRLYG